MHIAFLTPEYPHPRVKRSAGIGTSIKNLASALSQKHTITLFIYGQEEDAYFENEGIRIHLIQKRHYKLGGFYRYRKHINAYINGVVEREGINLIEAPDWTGITAFMKFKVPHIIRLHGTDTYFCNLEQRTQKKKNFYFEKKALRNADAVASVSAFTASKTKELFGLNTFIDVLYNLIDIDQFTPDNTANDTRSILYFGSVIRKKGVLALAKSFNALHKQLPDVELIYLGKDVIDYKTGESTQKMIKESLISSANEKVTFISEVSYAEVQNYIQEVSVVCLPSYAEAFPMTWLEAMAMEKPLVTSNIGWASELVIDKETGLTVHPDNTEGLSKALIKLLTDTPLAISYGKAARAHLQKHFSKELIVERNLAFYTKVLNR